MNQSSAFLDQEAKEGRSIHLLGMKPRVGFNPPAHIVALPRVEAVTTRGIPQKTQRRKHGPDSLFTMLSHASVFAGPSMQWGSLICERTASMREDEALPMHAPVKCAIQLRPGSGRFPSS
jgi:hypothetical protein